MENTGYFKIRIGSLLSNRPLPFDLFITLGQRYVHYVRLGDAITPDKLSKLDKVDVFFVPVPQRQAYKDFVFGRLNEENLSIEVKAEILRESSMALVEEIFENPNVEASLDDSKEVIHEFVSFIDENPSAISHLISLSSHDFYTYNHSLDVAIYSLGLGRIAGYAGNDLIELGRGSLFHDVGKREVDISIICKDGPLNDEEWAQMQKHPVYGLQILNEYDVSEEIKACCFEHHENFLGNGYPQALSGPEIHPMARIVALTDTFDALTTKRSYNRPMNPKDALDFITQKLAQRYDPELLKAIATILFKMQKDLAA